MIRIKIKSIRGTREINGAERYTANRSESHMRNLYSAGLGFETEILCDHLIETSQTARVQAFLADVVRELRAENSIKVKEEFDV